MNILFLVEGKRTEKKLYKRWVKYLCPRMEFVSLIDDLDSNNFTIISGGGYPQYYSIIKNAFLDIADSDNINYLFICVDSEEENYSRKLEDIQDFITTECNDINIEPFIIIQNHCIETWLMGNQRININNAQDAELIKYRTHYNVNRDDPESLNPIDERTIAQFTYKYLKLMLKHKHLNYSKAKVGAVQTETYFNQLVRRFNTDNHLQSFGTFLDAFNQINNSLEED